MKKLNVNKTRLVELNRAQPLNVGVLSVLGFCTTTCNTTSEASAGNKPVCSPSQVINGCATSHP